MAQLALKWSGEESQLFVGRDSYGHIVVSGSWPKDDDPTWTEWKGVKPSDLLVLALLSCSSYDVVTILRRQRQELTGLFVTAEAEQASEPPYQFTHIHLHYVAAGLDLDPKKVERAIVLSEEKYCSVAATIRSVTRITHSYAVTTAPGSAAIPGSEQ